MENVDEIKKYKFLLSFHDGHQLLFETNTDIRTAEREYINGGMFVVTDNQYTINLNQVARIQVKKQR
ncbi:MULTISPECIES: hypothetical protein [Psychrobacillus]|uniref:Uncharacterized protein n=1 Tax=Psychrobacillus faecigallinarum TaxID=2762235 RepID=A0ABR8R5Q5_9BACI|nr:MULTISPECIES: hypothetical protein [Psychrobacillus]MBD7943125.1 hypothetical protein [Psychrobacillus faecigallinarum]QEY20572.1 hypothetical protein D0S48_07575 [Psychrobacillus sp. AK 1817]QGM31112.1 hypothetical protein GI482_12250 [Bacillus sp. N3536]